MKERTFIACPAGCVWRPLQATDPETAYSKICSDYVPSRAVCILDPMTKTYNIYTRKLDKDGNLIKIEETELLYDA